MPKIKTKSGAKKRFKLTASGKVKVQQAGKRHGMIKRTAKFVRNARGTPPCSVNPTAATSGSFSCPTGSEEDFRSLTHSR